LVSIPQLFVSKKPMKFGIEQMEMMVELRWFLGVSGAVRRPGG